MGIIVEKKTRTQRVRFFEMKKNCSRSGSGFSRVLFRPLKFENHRAGKRVAHFTFYHVLLTFSLKSFKILNLHCKTLNCVIITAHKAHKNTLKWENHSAHRALSRCAVRFDDLTLGFSIRYLFLYGML